MHFFLNIYIKNTFTKTFFPDYIFCSTVSVPLFSKEEANGEVREAQMTPSSDSGSVWYPRGAKQEWCDLSAFRKPNPGFIRPFADLVPLMYSSAETLLRRFLLFLSYSSFTDVA